MNRCDRSWIWKIGWCIKPSWKAIIIIMTIRWRLHHQQQQQQEWRSEKIFCCCCYNDTYIFLKSQWYYVICSVATSRKNGCGRGVELLVQKEEGYWKQMTASIVYTITTTSLFHCTSLSSLLCGLNLLDTNNHIGHSWWREGYVCLANHYIHTYFINVHRITAWNEAEAECTSEKYTIHHYPAGVCPMDM